VRFHGGDLWITCALEFRGRWQAQWRAGHYTLLFFHDEAVSFAAGHRPCGECRRERYDAYRAAWAAGSGGGEAPTAREMNRQLHRERLVPRTHQRRLHEMEWADLPDGVFVVVDGTPAVVVGDHLTEWTYEGYGTRRARPRRGAATVLTPPSSVAAFHGGRNRSGSEGGYAVQVDGAAL
jgi:hypothetical protein